MFDIGWTEMAIIALIALVVIGPKDLPGAMRTVGHWVRRVRTVARDFQSGLDDMMRETELSEARKTIEGARNLNPKSMLKDTIDPTGEVDREARALQEDTERMEDRESGDEPKESSKAAGYKTTSASALKSSAWKPDEETVSTSSAEAVPEAAKDAAGDKKNQNKGKA